MSKLDKFPSSYAYFLPVSTVLETCSLRENMGDCRVLNQ